MDPLEGDAVTRCFYVLRRQLCQAGGDWGYRTMFEIRPKRGDRFNGEIARLVPQPTAASTKFGMRVG